jgi:putative ABC transport system ATP-binding protein
VQALRGITLSIEEGEFVAITGASGSGKSTFMNLIGCLDSPTRGTYHLNGHDVSRLSHSKLATIRNRNIGFVFQQFNLLPRASALENVELPMVYSGVGRRQRKFRARASLESVGLAHEADRFPAQLSGGQQQRVAIARALVNSPTLLLADEPTGALDSHTAREIMTIFKNLHRKGQAILVVTHNPDVAACTQRTVRLKDGMLIADVLNTAREAA